MKFSHMVTAALLTAGLAPLLIIGFLGIDRLKSEADLAARNAVAITGEAKRDAVDAYFKDQILWMETLAASPQTSAALEAMNAAGESLAAVGTVSVDEAAFAAYYEDRQIRTPGTDASTLERWRKGIDREAEILQQLFIVGNPNPEGQKQAAIDAAGSGRYGMAHRRFHSFFMETLDRFGFYDIFLIEPEEGRIVYSVMKEPDFATSLLDGPYRDSGFGRQVGEMIAARGAEGSRFADFEPYEPSFNAAASFLLIPIGTGKDFNGILAFQVSLDYVQSVVRKTYGDDPTGLRNYVVGPDLALRTIPDDTASLAIGDRLDSDLIRAMAADDSLTIIAARNEAGVEVIASVEDIELPGVEWTLISEVERDVAMAVSDEAERATLIATAILALVIAVAGLVVAKLLLRPIVKLGNELKREADIASEALRSAAKLANEAVQNVAAVAEETSSQAEVVRDSSSQASGHVQEVSTSVEQLTSSIADVASGVRETSSLMVDAASRTHEAETTLAELERVADRIRGMVDLINDVANRTNLLALNAAVEAAHAGEAGRGFAVVASEIRKLAGRTTESTEVIGSEVRTVLQAVQANSSAIREISNSVSKVSDMATSLSSAAEEQERVTDSIAQRMIETASRVGEVDQNIETVKVASSQSAQSAAALVSQLQTVDHASHEIAAAMDKMVIRIRKL